MIVTTRVLPGAVIRVSVDGDVDMATAQMLQDALAAAVEREGATGVVVDFANVPFCDSTGIAELDRAHAAATAKSLPFRLVDVQPGVARVLEIVGLLEILTRSRP
jgi:anti-anti-sigma factor